MNSSTLFTDFSLISIKCIAGFRTFVEYPILIAVLRLSLVNIQMLIPSFERDDIVFGTLSCHLSSIAAAPTIWIPVSISFATSEDFQVDNLLYRKLIKPLRNRTQWRMNVFPSSSRSVPRRVSFLYSDFTDTMCTIDIECFRVNKKSI